MRLYALILMIVLFAVTILVCTRSAVGILRESARQRSIVRSVEGISGAASSVINGITDVAKTAGREQYVQLLELVQTEEDSRLSEKELEGYFRAGYVNKIKRCIGSNSTEICSNLNTFLSDDGLRNLEVVDNGLTTIDEEADGEGSASSVRIKNVTIRHSDPVAGDRIETMSFKISIPDAVFHAGNDELFRYCMVACKGIYMTGPTSSVIGDIYAGRHPPEECREAEIEYGETGTYGGINMMSTQVGIRSDRIISEGDININGSFVYFDANNNRLECFAQRINEIDGFSKKAEYSMTGDFYPTNRLDGDKLQLYHMAADLIGSSLADIDKITIYYDSDNDRTYEGRYRKLITGTDVEIKDDFTGIVVARSNVIIRRDVNFEGIILCGDRIYAMGNNNIVANPGVARTIIASEGRDEYTVRVKDHLGGMKSEGITEPEYYVVPYRY